MEFEIYEYLFKRREAAWVNYWESQSECWIMSANGCKGLHQDEKNPLRTSQVSCPICSLTGKCKPEDIIDALLGVDDAD